MPSHISQKHFLLIIPFKRILAVENVTNKNKENITKKHK